VSLTNAQSIVDELCIFVIEAFKDEVALLEEQRNGEAINEGKEQLKMMRIAMDDPDKVIAYFPLWQQAFVRATALLMANNNKRLLALISHKH
jgi:hypothetical protein